MTSQEAINLLKELDTQFKEERQQFESFVSRIREFTVEITSFKPGESKEGEFQFSYLDATFQLRHLFRSRSNNTFESVAALFSSDKAFMLPKPQEGEPRRIRFDKTGRQLAHDDLGTATGKTLQDDAVELFSLLLFGK
jgi:hypothetical protein